MTAALDDVDSTKLLGVTRIETHPREQAKPLLLERMRSVYPHHQVYGDFCPVQGYVDAPPRDLFEWLADTRSLAEWTYSLRGFARTTQPGVWKGRDELGDDTDIYVRTISNPHAMTVDYHCAWDQGRHLWMVYLMRVVDAQIVLDKPGSVVLWHNCHHPFYDENPYPETAPADRPVWVGDFWEMFGPGHQIELENLTAIAEYRYHNGLPVMPDWMRS